MKKVLVFLLALAACGAESKDHPQLWTGTEDGMVMVGGSGDDASSGVDTGSGVDASNDVTQQDAESADVEPVDTGVPDTVTPTVDIPCDATNGVRLVQDAKDPTVFYDKMLDTECSFYWTKDAGTRCIPWNTKVSDPSQKATYGNPRFRSSDQALDGLLFGDLTCQNPVFLTGELYFDGWDIPKPDPKWGFTTTNHVVTEAYDLVTPGIGHVKYYYQWKNGKLGECAFDIVKCVDLPKVMQTKSFTATGPYSSNKDGSCGKDTYGTVSGNQGTAVLYSTGHAVNQKCPQQHGLKIFAAK